MDATGRGERGGIADCILAGGAGVAKANANLRSKCVRGRGQAKSAWLDKGESDEAAMGQIDATGRPVIWGSNGRVPLDFGWRGRYRVLQFRELGFPQ